MSRHYIDCEHQGSRARVTLGYDRQLDEFFLQVVRLHPEGDRIDEFLYLSSEDQNNRSDNLDYHALKLKEMAISIPEAMFQAVRNDATKLRGNYIVEHFSDGTTRVVLEE